MGIFSKAPSKDDLPDTPPSKGDTVTQYDRNTGRCDTYKWDGKGWVRTPAGTGGGSSGSGSSDSGNFNLVGGW